jgi:hypothetical protein
LQQPLTERLNLISSKSKKKWESNPCDKKTCKTRHKSRTLITESTIENRVLLNPVLYGCPNGLGEQSA